MQTTESDYQLYTRNLWKIFGPHPQQIKRNLDLSLSRAEVLEQTGHVVAVKDVSFGVRKGETFVVMGLSGSGKSTLVRCISRLIEPTDGQVVIEGEDLTAMTEKQLRALRRNKISMVFQHFGLFPHRKIIDNAAYGLEIQGIDKATRIARATEVLEIVGLKGWEHHYPGELSGGMQQRVGIARALAVDPEILLFDEPFSALDPLIRREMQDELINLQKMMQKTIIFITHDFLEAVKLGDYIAIMKDGEIVQVGTPQQVILNPVNDYVREFTKDVPRSRVITAQSILHPCQSLAFDTDSCQSVRTLMDECGQPFALVRNRQNYFLGLVDADAVEKAIGIGQAELQPLIRHAPKMVFPATVLADLIPVVAANPIPIPVIDGNHHLLGVVDQASVILALGSEDQTVEV